MKMKRLVFAITLMLATVITFAQDAKNVELKNKASELKNAGNAEYKKKNYAGALASWEKYQGAWKAYMAVDKEAKEDNSTYYNMATCARKLKDYDKAMSLLNTCVEKKYKADAATYYIAYCHKKKGDDAKAREVFEKGLQEFGGSKFARNFRKQVTVYMNKDAAAIFNAANDISGKATGKPAAEYLAIMKKAVAKFNQAKAEFNKVLKVDPKNKTAAAGLQNINAAIQAYKDYKAQLDAQKK
ncbi:tetratricopeptide repeat protein [Prolixibacteraceae bacterium JC049]|nr:tetratricopeptide repeat protein [Prolixibacteraceae bacterium JC049]